MRIPTEQLADRLTKGLAPLYTIFGAEPLLVLEGADRIRAAARNAGYTEREVLIAESGFNWNELGMRAASRSLFGDKRIFELRIPTGKPGVDGGKALETFAASPPDDTVTLVLLSELDHAGQAAKWFQALEAAGVMIEAQPVTRDRLPEWLSRRLAGQHQRASAEALRFIADRVEGNLLAAFQEVQKLGLIFPAGEISFEQIRGAVVDVSRYDVFQLGEAILTGNVERIIRMLDGLRGEGEAPPLILWAISAEIRALLIVAAALQAGKPITPQMQGEYRLWGARKTQLERAARKRDLGSLQAALMQAQETDRLIKGLTRGDVWDALLQLALLAAGKAVLPVGAAVG